MTEKAPDNTHPISLDDVTAAASALAGGIFVAFCDVIARVIPSTGEIPLGVVTGLVGAPVFLVILIRSRRTGR